MITKRSSPHAQGFAVTASGGGGLSFELGLADHRLNPRVAGGMVILDSPLWI